MTKNSFLKFYNKTVKVYGEKLVQDYPQFQFCDNADGLYEEYLNQKNIMRLLYDKQSEPKKQLLDRHKVCACMVCAIIKVRLLSGKMDDDKSFELSFSSSINEQLAFLSTWALFEGFLKLHWEQKRACLPPDTFHNDSFEDTITRSLYFSNLLNSLSAPLIANIFYLLEVYLELQPWSSDKVSENQGVDVTEEDENL